MPISRWYVWALIVGLGLFVLGYATLLFPVWSWSGAKWDLFAVRLVHPDGTPAARESVYAVPRPSLGDSPFPIGETDSKGELYVILRLARSGTQSLLGRNLTTWEQEDRLEVCVNQGGDRRLLGVADGVRMPTSVIETTPASLGRLEVRQVTALPTWAADVEILHATIER